MADSGYQSAFPVNTVAGTNPVLPYAVGNVAAYDLFDGNGRAVTAGGAQDGYTDLLYAGDLNGTFYTVVMNSATTSSSPVPTCMVGRKVQPVVNANSNPYRGLRQPITVTPVGALDKDGNMRVYFGTGKFDDVPKGAPITIRSTTPPCRSTVWWKIWRRNWVIPPVAAVPEM